MTNLTMYILTACVLGTIVYTVYQINTHNRAKTFAAAVGKQWKGMAITLVGLAVLAGVTYLLESTGTLYYWSNSGYTYGVISKMQATQTEYGTNGLNNWYRKTMTK